MTALLVAFTLAHGVRLLVAAPGDEPLFAGLGRCDRLYGVGAQARGLVARQCFQLFAHLELVAFVEGDAVLHRNLNLAASIAARRRLFDYLHFGSTGRHVYPGAGGGGTVRSTNGHMPFNISSL